MVKECVVCGLKRYNGNICKECDWFHNTFWGESQRANNYGDELQNMINLIGNHIGHYYFTHTTDYNPLPMTKQDFIAFRESVRCKIYEIDERNDVEDRIEAKKEQVANLKEVTEYMKKLK